MAKYLTESRAQELINQIKERLAQRVNLAGDTMTGELKVPTIELGSNALGEANNIIEIGGGADADHKANVFSVDKDGNVVAAGDITDGDGNKLSDVVAKATKAYIPKGTCEFTALPTADADKIGWVYNVINTDNTDPDNPVLGEFTIDNRFIEYDASQEKTFPSGTNIVIVEDEESGSTVYKFDVLSGFIDTQAIIDSIEEISSSDLEDMWGD